MPHLRSLLRTLFSRENLLALALCHQALTPAHLRRAFPLSRRNCSTGEGSPEAKRGRGEARPGLTS